MLNGKTAVITGASRGIGAAIAEKLASLGANIAILDMNEEAAINEKSKIEALGVKAEAYVCNVSSQEECKNTIKNVTSDFGGVDILVNNAGITRDNLLVVMDEAEFDAVIDTNLKGCYNMIKACGRSFIKKKYGKIINIASVSGIMGNAGQANYAASKAGLIGLTKSVAKELASRNIRCNAIAPGFIQTAMTDKLKEEVRESYRNAIPLKRFGQVADIANLVLFLASERASYITGQVIHVDGGLVM